MKNDYQIAFIDIDWTILDHNTKDWDYPSLEAIKKLQQVGVLIVFATARSYASVVGTGLLNLVTPNGIITNNGGLTFFDDKIINKNTFPEELVRKVLDVANKHQVVLQFACLKDRHFTLEPNDYVRQYFSVYYEAYPPIRQNDVSNVTERITTIITLLSL